MSVPPMPTLFPDASHVWLPAPGTQVTVTCVEVGPRALGSPVTLHLAWDTPGGQWRARIPVTRDFFQFFVPAATASDTLILARADQPQPVQPPPRRRRR